MTTARRDIVTLASDLFPFLWNADRLKIHRSQPLRCAGEDWSLPPRRFAGLPDPPQHP